MHCTMSLALAVALIGCGDKAADTGTDSSDDQIAADLWAAIDGYQSWNQSADWTGIQASADGAHGPYVQIWFNDAANDTIASAAGGDMADGAILVKEGYSEESGATVASLTVMQKIAGYNVDGGDWFWAKFTPDGGAVESAGIVSGCEGCHTAGQDYVRFETW